MAPDPCNPDSAYVDVLTARAGYDRWAGIYDEEDNPLITLEERYLPDQLGPVDGLHIADIGCGTGRHALRLAASGAEVTAVDFSERMLAKARHKPRAESVRFVRHDITAPLPFKSASFDRVLCCLVLEHVPDLRAFFAEMQRVCRPEGFLLFSAMHPAMMLLGITARFTDPATGRETRPQSYPYQIADFIMAARRAGLGVDHLSEHSIDQALADVSPRAAKYLGWPLLLLMRFRFDASVTSR